MLPNVTNLFEIIPAHSYLALADLSDKTRGSKACRQLLSKIIKQLNLTGHLIENQYPYYFEDRSNTYYVSFSHSTARVAVLISLSPYIGVDVENKPISRAVAQRYFAKDEILWLESLPATQQPKALTLLWTLKESLIKANTKKDSQLFSGIQKSIVSYFGLPTLHHLLTISAYTLASYHHQHWSVSHIFAAQCSVVMFK